MVKKIRSARYFIMTFILLSGFSFSLFSTSTEYADLPVLAFTEIINVNYTILEESNDYLIIVIDGKTYYVEK